jgi:undecaprenyl phosphate N,N'-diacetylbacillosamine 1-phosphate transferase
MTMKLRQKKQGGISNICFLIQKYIKRMADLAISLMLIIIFSPLFIVVSVLIKVDSIGPIFFIQKRPGYLARLFNIFKFRTMKVNSEIMIKGKEVDENDKRITNIGRLLRKYKIDELPQLLNVFKGEMSLVGPRPERIESLKEYDSQIAKRHNMKPGMTGLAQVNGNIYLDLKDRYKFDVYYVENYSLLLDLRIILKTILVVFFGEDRYKNNSLIDLNKRF